MTEGEWATEKVAPYLEQIARTPALLSLLYDVDLLPEQIVTAANARRMIALCECFKVMTPDQIAALMTPRS